MAQRTGAAVQVRDRAGHPVASSPGFTAQPGPPSGAAVVVCGQRIGEAVTRFTGAGLSAADRRLQAALLRAIAGAAGLAALLALVTGLVAARRITRPVAKLIAVTRAMTAGDRSARAGPVRARRFDAPGIAVDRQLAWPAHGGQLTAASQQGHGTTMTLTLPGA